MQITPELRLGRAYTTLITSFPFFATVLLRLERTEDPTAKTMWTDGTRLGYNPKFVESITSDQLVGVLTHEVMHVVGLHPWRQGKRNNKAWNIACDHVVNAIVEESKLALPEGALPGVPDKAAEELYQEPLPGGGGKQKQKQKGGGSGQGQPQQGDGGDGDPDPGGCGEVREPTNPDGSALTEAAREHQMHEARITIQQAINAAKRAGKLPAGLARYAEDALEPKVPWREILAQFVDQHARHDYSWARPNRRYFSDGIMFPSLWSPAYGEIVMGCDTSGSIDPAQLKEICSEILGCLEEYAERGQSPELTVAWFDARVYEQTVDDADQLAPKGGGGTSFSVVFKWLGKRETPMPRAIVMVTDGHCSDYGEAPECPVLWILTATNKGFTPPFGELTHTLNE